jgi:hypothetical protein
MNEVQRAACSLALVAAILLVSACGAPMRQSQTGVVESTQLTLVAKQLVGLEILVDGRSRGVLTEDDLEPYPYGILGAADKPAEDHESATIDVTPGTHEIRVTSRGRSVYEQRLYFGDGQKRMIEL